MDTEDTNLQPVGASVLIHYRWGESAGIRDLKGEFLLTYLVLA